MTIPILFEDGEALVIDKPAGLPVDPPRRGGPSLASRLRELRLGFRREPSPVHRLDTDTSGCLLLARNPKAMKRFSAAFEQRQARKAYIGIVDGEPAGEEGAIDLPLAKISSAERGWRMVPDAGGKPAFTRWKVLARIDGRTVLAFRPETGRTHQIRIHAAAGLGHPLLGDPVYGPHHGVNHGAPRTMLHAVRLIVPRTGKPPVVASAPLPPDMLALGACDG